MGYTPNIYWPEVLKLLRKRVKDLDNVGLMTLRQAVMRCAGITNPNKLDRHIKGLAEAGYIHAREGEVERFRILDKGEVDA